MIDKSPATITVDASRIEVSETLRVSRALMDRLLELSPNLIRRKYDRGEALYRQDEPASHAFVVVSGRVAISMVGRRGQEMLIDIVGEGALCGEGAAFDGCDRFSNARAIEPATVLSIAGDQFMKLTAADLRLATLLAHTVALKQRTLAVRLAEIAQSPPEDRIELLFSQMPLSDASVVSLTHQQIADLIGASRITVTRAMQRLRKAGKIESGRGRCLIKPVARRASR